MLNTFPSLLDFSLLSPFILRVAVGIFFIAIGYIGFKKEIFKKSETSNKSILVNLEKGASILEIIAGVSIVAGFLTQISAMALILLAISEIIKISYQTGAGALVKPESKIVYLFVIVICVSLILSGAGAFAFDLPL